MEETNYIQYLVPLMVALIGVFQIGLSLWAGRKTSQATATKDEASATKEISESYATLIEALEKRLAAEQKKYDLLCEENERLRERIKQLEKELENGNGNSKHNGTG